MPKRFVVVPGRSLSSFEDNERGLALYRALPDPPDGVLRVEPWSFDDRQPADGFRISARLRRGDRVAGFHQFVTVQQLRSATASVRDAIVARVRDLIAETEALLMADAQAE